MGLGIGVFCMPWNGERSGTLLQPSLAERRGRFRNVAIRVV